MTEFELLARLIPTLPANNFVVKGAGDDCAVLEMGMADRLLVLKTDAVVEGVHFTKEAPSAKVGRKALARVLSDLAAAAATPVACLVTAGLPKDFDQQYVFDVYEGLNALAREYSVAVVGGETTRTTGSTFFSIAAIGTIPRGRLITRSGAKAGDAIFVTGDLGGSISAKHLDFEPRLKEAEWLASNFAVHSMLDLSDGLAGDLRHILHASGVGAELLSNAIPISRAAKLQARGESSAKPPLLAALTDGEDYELLFTLAPNLAVSLLDAWKSQFKEVKISCIGRITAHPGLRIRDKDGIREFGLHGYTHFQKS
jgi:thiamine-monophosphate kinase